ncbi:MAG: hypothetical protein GY703_17825 [Gammaproteobacteria bacterium]|nr:hypothetical protein [Gammaproteobacteria bacterium]
MFSTAQYAIDKVKFPDDCRRIEHQLENYSEFMRRFIDSMDKGRLYLGSMRWMARKPVDQVQAFNPNERRYLC